MVVVRIVVRYIPDWLPRNLDRSLCVFQGRDRFWENHAKCLGIVRRIAPCIYQNLVRIRGIQKVIRIAHVDRREATWEIDSSILVIKAFQERPIFVRLYVGQVRKGLDE